MTQTTPFQAHSAAAYGAAVIITTAAIGLRLALSDVFLGYPFVTVFPAVILSTLVGGAGPGVLALFLGGLGAWYFVIPEVHTFGLKTRSDALGVLFYGLVSVFIIWALVRQQSLIALEHAGRTELAAALKEKSALLRERELLLTEVRHRVGNNLQQITGLLLLHSRRIVEPMAKEAFENARARVNLFAEVHQSLYRTGSGTVDLNAVLHNLAARLVSAHRPVGIACRVEIDPTFQWQAEQAVPIVMVTHELICNALEHGFGEAGIGTITVLLGRTPTGLVRLLVADDGSGVPPQVDPERSNSLGLSIVRAFARQLNGTFGLHPGENGRGTVAELVFDVRPRDEPSLDDIQRTDNAA